MNDVTDFEKQLQMLLHRGHDESHLLGQMSAELDTRAQQLELVRQKLSEYHLRKQALAEFASAVLGLPRAPEPPRPQVPPQPSYAYPPYQPAAVAPAHYADRVGAQMEADLDVDRIAQWYGQPRHAGTRA